MSKLAEYTIRLVTEQPKDQRTGQWAVNLAEEMIDECHTRPLFDAKIDVFHDDLPYTDPKMITFINAVSFYLQ